MTKSSSNLNDPECSRTVLPDIDFKSINGCRTTILEDKSSKSINDHPEKQGPIDCKLVLEDDLADGPTATYKILNENSDKTQCSFSSTLREEIFRFLDKEDPFA